MKNIIIFFIFIVFLFSCKSLDEIVIEKIDDESREDINQIELDILSMKFFKNTGNIDEIEKKIKTLDVKTKKNKIFKAKTLGLFGEVAFLRKDNVLVKNIISKIEAFTQSEENLYVLKANLTDNLFEKENIVREGIEKADSTKKLKLYLADIFFLQKKFEEAVALYDETFLQIPEDYKKFYIERREVGYRFIKTPLQNVDIAKLLTKEKITVGEALEITVGANDFLKKIVKEKYKNNEELFRILNEKYNFFYKDSNNLLKYGDLIKRKDAAFFLASAISYIEEGDLINLYKPKETDILPSKESKDLSPIPDVKSWDYFYSAALILVEREIMDLPDGERFFPENYLKGLEYFEILEKLK